MDIENFREEGHKLIDWIADYYQKVDELPVKSQSKPEEILKALPQDPPQEGEEFNQIFSDFQDIIFKGITHWQSPNFFAYFPANSSFPSILAEILTASLGQQGMIWDTSPAATELEEQMMNWLKQMMHLPESWDGVIQDTASTATLCAILTAREKYSDFNINQNGFQGNEQFVIYGSDHMHSSIDKAVKIAGLGANCIKRIPTDEEFAMIPEALEKAILQDIAEGKKPLCVVAAIGTTSSTAIDPLKPIGEICQKHQVWLHIDAAYAGTATILPEYHWMIEGIELADSYVFNPHKWMFTNFDCTAYFVKDKSSLIRTFEILPEYLKTKNENTVNNYRDWGIQLGRRFRSLKLWFVIRSFGTEGIQRRLRDHISYAQYFEAKIKERFPIEILAPTSLNLVCFRFAPDGWDNKQIDRLNQRILEKVNLSGKAYLTHTKLNNKYCIRSVFGQTYLKQKHVDHLITTLNEIYHQELALTI